MQSTVVFLGPSLAQQTARSILEADYRPPVRKGDVYSLLTGGFKRIVIIDGIFHHSPSVWQREILAAVDQGIEVIGAASMGALRASELHEFGMIGWGTIFEWYRDGILDGDDEVALQHASEEDGYRAFSEPLVNIRYTLRRATEEGKLTPEEEDQIVARMKATFYPSRSYRALIESVLVQSWTPERRDDFQSYLYSGSINLKARDARGVLEHCAQNRIGASARHSVAVDTWSAEFRADCLRFRPLPDQKKIDPNRLNSARRDIFTRWFLADWARLRGVSCPPDYMETFSSHWASRNQAEDIADWTRSRGLTLQEHDEILTERTIASWLRMHGPRAFGLDWDAEAAARLDERLSGSDATHGLRPDDAAFLSAWARDNGICCPKSQRSRLLESWGLSSLARRREMARDLFLHPRSFRRALAERITGAWLIEAGPFTFGYSFNHEIAIRQELQHGDAGKMFSGDSNP